MRKIGCLLFTMLLSNFAMAASNASLVLAGFVDEICILEIDPVINASIDIDVASAISALTVGTFNLEHNFVGGYTLTVASANAGELVHENGSASGSVAYTIDWTPAVGTAETDIVNGGQPFISDPTGGFQNITGDIDLNIAAPIVNPTAGLYSDELTFTLAAL